MPAERRLKSLADLGTPEALCNDCLTHSPLPWTDCICPNCGEVHTIMRQLRALAKDIYRQED